jgi:hypothetical protein
MEYDEYKNPKTFWEFIEGWTGIISIVFWICAIAGSIFVFYKLFLD